MRLGRGAVVLVALDPTIGHEQRGVRPCIVVSDPEVISDQRYPLVCVVPVTGTPGEGLLYPPLAPLAGAALTHVMASLRIAKSPAWAFLFPSLSFPFVVLFSWLFSVRSN